MNEVTEMSVDSFNGFGKKCQFLKTMIGSRLVRSYWVMDAFEKLESNLAACIHNSTDTP